MSNRSHEGCRPGCRPRRRRAGFSIVELMVAIALGGILMAGAVSLFVNNRDTSRFTNELAQMQESARFAVEMIMRDLRMAGYFGCQNDAESITSLVAVDALGGETGALWDVTFPIEGYDGTIDNTQWYPSGYATNLGAGAVEGTDGNNGQILPGTDAVVVRFLQGNYSDEDTDGTPDAELTASTLSALTANNLDGSVYEEGGMAGVSDCGGTDVFIVDNDPSAGGDVVNVYTAVSQLSREYSVVNAPMVAPYVARRYYIGRNARGRPALYRTTMAVDAGARNSYAELPQELFEGIENMQILYGVDRDDDGAPDAFLPAGDTGAANEEDDLDLAAEWRQVVAVKIALLVRSNNVHQGADVSANSYQLLDASIVPGGNFRRRVFTSMAVLRNLQ